MSRASDAMLRLLSEAELRWMVEHRTSPDSTRRACRAELARRAADGVVAAYLREVQR